MSSMCGIVGFSTREDCVPQLLEGLQRLEYRGYDSAGVAVLQEDGSLGVQRAVGRIQNLRQALEQAPLAGCCGIGHTRWATHGRPSVENSHPHCDQKRTLAVVHNGIIENYRPLKEQLQAQGVQFRSETDTEVVAQLLAWHYKGSMLETLQEVLPLLEGSFALGVVLTAEPHTLYCARRKSPLLAAKGPKGGAIASDISTLLDFSRELYPLEEDSIAVLSPESLRFYRSGKGGEEFFPQPMAVTWDLSAAQKGGYEHFMLKEIFDQPAALRDTLNHYVDLSRGCIRREVMPFGPEEAKALSRVNLAACGTAYHAAVMGATLLEEVAHIPASAHIASEYRYSPLLPGKDEVFFAVSQSGETADTLAALHQQKERGLRCCALSNVIGSTIAREADFVLYTLAGPEIAVASTKAYTTQVLVFEILALDLAHLRGVISDAQLKEALDQLAQLPEQVEQVLAQKEQVEAFVAQQRNCRDVFFIGRLMDYASSLEAALKLKEISYLHSEAYAAGELKHGTIALVDESCLVVVTATQEAVLEKTLANLEEVRARGAKILLLGHFPQGCSGVPVWNIPKAPQRLAPLLTTVYAQLFAYYMAKLHGCDIDKPRNLAKSVTVE